MLRLITGRVARALVSTNLFNTTVTAQRVANRSISSAILAKNNGILTNLVCSRWLSPISSQKLLQPPTAATSQQLPVRTVTKFSLVKGKRKSVKAVIKRFKRLDWGIWIRTHSGRNKKLFKKSAALKRRLRQHIFTNAQQSWLLDSMVTDFWRRPKHYIDDPYEPYHKRDEYFATKSKTFKV